MLTKTAANELILIEAEYRKALLAVKAFKKYTLCGPAKKLREARQIARNEAKPVQQIECRECGKPTAKIFLKTMKSLKQKNRAVYVDKTGQQWNGNTCPRCKYGR